MPISAPGAYSYSCRSRGLRGFTLIEVLVVLLIMGLLAGLASAIVRPDDRALLRIEAERLAQLLELAATEARLGGQALAWTADDAGYRFWRASGGERGPAQWSAQWSEIGDDDLLRARKLPQGVVISEVRIENNLANAARRVEFAPYSTLSFSIAMSLGAASVSVAASPIGEMRVIADEGKPHG